MITEQGCLSALKDLDHEVRVDDLLEVCIIGGILPPKAWLRLSKERSFHIYPSAGEFKFTKKKACLIMR